MINADIILTILVPNIDLPVHSSAYAVCLWLYHKWITRKSVVQSNDWKTEMDILPNIFFSIGLGKFAFFIHFLFWSIRRLSPQPAPDVFPSIPHFLCLQASTGWGGCFKPICHTALCSCPRTESLWNVWQKCKLRVNSRIYSNEVKSHNISEISTCSHIP